MAAAWEAIPSAVSSLARRTFPAVPGFLKDAGTECGINIGLQAERAELEFPGFAQIVKENFNLMTPGNELKWPRIHPTPDSFNFTDGDWMVDFCESNRLMVHGHNLCWNSPSANPAWFHTVLDKSNASRYLTEHITTVMRHYSGRVDSWDIVNEPTVFWSRRPDGLYPGIWLNLLGPTYIDVAFHAAAAADPKALRIMNVYDVEHGIADHEKNRTATVRLLEELLDRGVPIQAVGVESHLDTTLPPGGAGLSRFIKQVRDMGLQMLITELDVNDTGVQGSFQERDEVVAKTYGNYLMEVVPSSGTKNVIFWTPTDKWDWLNSIHSAKFERADKTMHRPGLLDYTMQRKPAFGTVHSTVEEICAKQGR